MRFLTLSMRHNPGIEVFSTILFYSDINNTKMSANGIAIIQNALQQLTNLRVLGIELSMI